MIPMTFPMPPEVRAEQLELSRTTFDEEARRFKLARLALRTHVKMKHRDKALLDRDLSLASCNFALDLFIDCGGLDEGRTAETQEAGGNPADTAA